MLWVNITVAVWGWCAADKLYAGTDAVGMLSDYVLSATNTNVHAYGTAPFYATVEVAVLARMRAIMGLPSSGDGVFCPGGSYSNLLAMLAARERCAPANKTVRGCGHRVTVRCQGQRAATLAVCAGVGVFWLRWRVGWRAGDRRAFSVRWRLVDAWWCSRRTSPTTPSNGAPCCVRAVA